MLTGSQEVKELTPKWAKSTPKWPPVEEDTL